MNRHRFVLLLLPGILLSLAGCGGQQPNPKSSPFDPGPNPKATTDSPAKPVPVAETKPAPTVIPEDSAAAAVQKTIKALEAGDLAQAYEFLPASYQSDIDGLVHEFAEQMDLEVWTRLGQTARKMIQVLRTKKEFIFALDLFRGRPEAEQYCKTWDTTLEVISNLADSDAADLGRLKQVSAKSLLSFKSTPTLQHFDALGRAIGADLSRQFSGVSVTSIRSSGAEHVVGLQGPGDEKPMEITYVKHQDHWLPKSLVEHWQDGIAADRAWLQKLPERIRAVKPQLLEAADQANNVLDQLLAAENREQFERVAGPAILSLAVEWPRLQQLATQAAIGSSVRTTVTVSINRELTDSELTKLSAAVLKPLQESGTDYTLLANDGKTTCRLIRCSDVAALQASLAAHFGLGPEALSLDAENSILKINLDP